MQPGTVEQRLTILEQKMDELKDLPARVERVESQILQLRTEIKDEFSAIRGEMRELRQELRDDIRIGVEESQNLTKGLHAEAMGAMNDLHGQAMRAMNDLHGQAMRAMTDLHDRFMPAIASVDAAIRRDVVSRLDRILELQRPGDRPT